MRPRANKRGYWPHRARRLCQISEPSKPRKRHLPNKGLRRSEVAHSAAFRRVAIPQAAWGQDAPSLPARTQQWPRRNRLDFPFSSCLEGYSPLVFATRESLLRWTKMSDHCLPADRTPRELCDGLRRGEALQRELAEAGADAPPGRDAKDGVGQQPEPKQKVEIKFPAGFISPMQQQPDCADRHDHKPEEPGKDKKPKNCADAGMIGSFGGERGGNGDPAHRSQIGEQQQQTGSAIGVDSGCTVRSVMRESDGQTELDDDDNEQRSEELTAQRKELAEQDFADSQRSGEY